jgi:peroxiredoxin
MRLPLLGVVLALLVPVIGAPAPLAAQDTGLKVGSRAPVVRVNDLDGKPVDLGRWVGKKPVLLEWWATWCEQCDVLLPRLKAAHTQVGDAVEFVAVNVAVNQSPEKVRKFVAARGVPYTVLYDVDGASTRAYEAPATSYVVIVDRTGHVAYTGVGGDQQFLAALRRVATP